MTKEVRNSWLRTGVAVILIASSIIIFVDGQPSTEQMVLQGIVFVLALGLLAQGVTGLVTARRR